MLILKMILMHLKLPSGGIHLKLISTTQRVQEMNGDHSCRSEIK